MHKTCCERKYYFHTHHMYCSHMTGYVLYKYYILVWSTGARGVSHVEKCLFNQTEIVSTSDQLGVFIC